MISLKDDKSYCKVIEWFPNYCQLEGGCHISNKVPYSNPIQPELSCLLRRTPPPPSPPCTCDVKTAHDKGTKVIMDCFHMTTRRPYWCPKTMEGRPCWCPKPVLWELNSFLVQTFSFVRSNLHRCWPRE